MKNKLFILLGVFGSFCLTACPVVDDDGDISYDGDNYQDKMPENHKGGLILQAFNWTYKQIEANIPTIAENGFKIVQTSPVQQPKSNGSAWWTFYQPLSFSISNDSPLGTKEDLKSLCKTAKEYGVSIIVDAVLNHMANISDDDLESDGTPKVSPDVEQYEPDIYKNRNASGSNATFHHNKTAQGSGAVTQYYPYGKLPDLNTSNPVVQNRISEFLKECVDVGVDGFRFDAAKHIETPDDPDYASDFWTKVLGDAQTEYETVEQDTNKKLFLLGEVLGSPDGGRELECYTKLMNVTEDGYISGVSSASSNKDAIRAVNAKYGKTADLDKLVTWVESHDTYISATGGHVSDKKFIRQWATIASRKGTSSSFLSRPDENASVGTIANYTFENPVVGEINKFHNRFLNAEEYQSVGAEKAVYINERVSETDEGVMIIDYAASGHVKGQLKNVADGKYVDAIAGKVHEIKKGKIDFDIDESGVCILTHTKKVVKPSYTISERDSSFIGSKTITIETKNCKESSYAINDGEYISFTNKVDVTIGSQVDANKQVKIKIKLVNDGGTVEKTFTYTKLESIQGYFNVFNLNPSYLTDYELYMWTWSSSNPGKWIKPAYTMQSGVMLIDVSQASYTSFLFAIFTKGYTISNVNSWDNKVLKQTQDILVSQGYYDASNF